MKSLYVKNLLEVWIHMYSLVLMQVENGLIGGCIRCMRWGMLNCELAYRFLLGRTVTV